ncbi:hypothetical protein TUBRATIS_19720 [Tubulinosema ratisbonensis]|uniref:Uncharacterized protein n=1 Tax=Tubulinosema ratisbonensis TaxID=291195 RepID=A0A437AK54_9MICR|nr:hypothetical protein TUBRATIS_19720 [Tubulinosema ratisbonensis]
MKENTFIDDKNIEKIDPSNLQEKDNNFIFFENEVLYSKYEYKNTFLVSIKCLIFSAIKDYLLTYTENEIIVYKWNKEMEFKKIKIIKHSFLQFLIKTNAISKKTFVILSKIFLNFIKIKVKRPDLHLEKLLKELNILKIYEIEQEGNFLTCVYKNFIGCTFDNKMKLLEKRKYDFNDKPKKEFLKIEANTLTIQRMKNIQEKFYFDEINQYSVLENYLFILNEGGLKILEFKSDKN